MHFLQRNTSNTACRRAIQLQTTSILREMQKPDRTPGILKASQAGIWGMGQHMDKLPGQAYSSCAVNHSGDAVYFQSIWRNKNSSAAIDHPVRSVVAFLLDSSSVCTFQWRFSRAVKPSDWYISDPLTLSQKPERFVTPWEKSQVSLLFEPWT